MIDITYHPTILIYRLYDQSQAERVTSLDKLTLRDVRGLQKLTAWIASGRPSCLRRKRPRARQDLRDVRGSAARMTGKTAGSRQYNIWARTDSVHRRPKKSGKRTSRLELDRLMHWHHRTPGFFSIINCARKVTLGLVTPNFSGAVPWRWYFH